MVLLFPAVNSHCSNCPAFLNSTRKVEIFPGAGMHLNSVTCWLLISYRVTLVLDLTDLTSASERKGMRPSGNLLR